MTTKGPTSSKRTSLELVSHKLWLESLLERFAIFFNPSRHPFTPPSTERGTLLCPYLSVSARTPLVHRLLCRGPLFLLSSHKPEKRNREQSPLDKRSTTKNRATGQIKSTLHLPLFFSPPPPPSLVVYTSFLSPFFSTSPHRLISPLPSRFKSSRGTHYAPVTAISLHPCTLFFYFSARGNFTDSTGNNEERTMIEGEKAVRNGMRGG